MITAQSATGAIITLIALLLIAVIIGYFTSWFYAKSVYTPVIKGLENDKANLNIQVAGLKDENKKLEKSIEELGEKIGELKKTVAEQQEEIEKLKEAGESSGGKS
jgi:peptidoglycan hydrolase CwlO-like protein